MIYSQADIVSISVLAFKSDARNKQTTGNHYHFQSELHEKDGAAAKVKLAISRGRHTKKLIRI
jgi:hypothetical protein